MFDKDGRETNMNEDNITMYFADPINQIFFFTTDDIEQEVDDDFVNVSSTDPLWRVRRDLQETGYKEIPNPDPEYSPIE